MIKRAKRTANFTIINNEIFKDNFLSLEAMGLLNYLLSKPDNWKVNVKALSNATAGTDQKRGTNKIYDLLKVLEKKGFVVRQKLSSGAVDYTVYDEPVTSEPNHGFSEQAKPITSKPEQEKPEQEKPEQDSSETYKELKVQQELKSKKELKNNKAVCTDNTSPEKSDDNSKDSGKPNISKPMIVEVFEHWQTVMKKPSAKLLKARETIIRNTLKIEVDGVRVFTVDDLKLAIDGVAKSPFYMGQNDRNTAFNDFKTIFKSAEGIESFMEVSGSSGKKNTIGFNRNQDDLPYFETEVNF